MSDTRIQPMPPDGPPPPPDVVDSPLRRFCQTCGDPWDPNGYTCGYCESRAARPMVALSESDPRPIIQTVIFYSSMLAISIVTLVVMVVGKEEATLTGLTVETVAFSVVVLTFAAIFCKDIKPSMVRLGPPKWILAAPLMAVGTFGIADGVITLLHKGLGIPTIDYLPTFVGAGHGFALAMLFVAVQPAIFEEVAFRGLIFGWLSKVLGPLETVLVTAVIFAILHLQLAALPHLAIIGITLGFVRLRSGSLYPGIILHFSHNFFCILTEYVRNAHGH